MLRTLRMVLPVTIILLGTILAVSLVVGPERLPVISRWFQPPPDPPPIGLRETFDALRQWHRQGSHSLLRPFIEPESRETVMDLIAVIEELRAANAAALEAGEATCRTFDAKAWDLAPLLDAIELFSKELSVTDVKEGDTTGQVLVVIGSPPPVPIDFKRVDNRWVYMPGETMAAAVPILRELAQALGRAAIVFRSGSLTRAQIDEEYLFRVDPKLVQLRKLTAQSRPSPGSER